MYGNTVPPDSRQSGGHQGSQNASPALSASLSAAHTERYHPTRRSPAKTVPPSESVRGDSHSASLYSAPHRTADQGKGSDAIGDTSPFHTPPSLARAPARSSPQQQLSSYHPSLISVSIPLSASMQHSSSRMESARGPTSRYAKGSAVRASPLWPPLSDQVTPITANNASAAPRESQVIMGGATPAGTRPSRNAVAHYKTRRCRHFDQSGWCPYQHRCVFAHGDRELAVYTARRNAMQLETSEQVKDHIARNVQNLVEEYEQAVFEAAAAKTKQGQSVRSNEPARGAPLISQRSSLNVYPHRTVLTAPPTPPSSASTLVLSHPQQQQQQQQPYAMAAAQSIRLATAEEVSAYGGDHGPLLARGEALHGQPQSFYFIQQPLPSQQHPTTTQQQQQQQRVILALPANTQGYVQLQAAAPPPPPPSQPQQQQEQQLYVMDGSYLQAVQMPNGYVLGSSPTEGNNQGNATMLTRYAPPGQRPFW